MNGKHGNAWWTCCRNPKPLLQVEPKLLVDQKNRKAFATGGDILLANGQKIPLPGGFALPTTGLWSGLLDIPEVPFLQTLSQNAPSCTLASKERWPYSPVVWQCPCLAAMPYPSRQPID